MMSSDIESRIFLLLDGKLSNEESRALELELCSDSTAIALYRKCARLHSALETQLLPRAVLEQAGVVPMDRLMKQQREKVIRVSWISALAAVVIIALVLLRFVISAPPPPIVTFQSASDSMIQVTHAGGGKKPEQGGLAEGSRLQLAAGTSEFKFASGVRAILKAPCDLTVGHEGHLQVDQGTIWFRVPKQATGFTVTTPDLVVVDLGTEFGVIVSDSGVDEVHVFKGTVEATPRNGGGGERLEAPQARLATSLQTLEERTPDLTLFRTELRQPKSVKIANHSFEKDILPRDGDVSTKLPRQDDYNKDLIPSDWLGGGNGGAKVPRGLVSTASDSYFSKSLKATPHSDANDQVYYSSGRDIYQVLDERLEANCIYTLTVDVGDRKAKGGEGNPGHPNIRLGLGSMPEKGLLEASATKFPDQIDGGWVTWSVTYRTGADPAKIGERLRIELTAEDQVSWFDNVRLTVTR